MTGMALGGIAVGWMNRGLRGRHSKDEPTVTNVEGPEFQHVAKESAVRFGIFAVKEEVRSGNHARIVYRLENGG